MTIYVVQPGDTLYLVAERLGVSSDSLLKLNPIADPTRLVPGQALLIPAPVPEPLRYTVVSGDTLYLIAQAFATTVQAIIQASGITNPNLLQIGQVLTIPGWSGLSYTVLPGDTLYRIAGRFGVSMSLVAKANHITNPALIYPGQALVIPQPITPAIKQPMETTAYFHLYNMSGLQRSLAQIGTSITYGNLFHFPFSATGTLTISTNTSRAVGLLKSFNIRPFPVITNSSPNVGFDSELARSIIATPDTRSRAITAILQLLDQYGFAGANIDFENMYPEDRSLYTAFIQELSTALTSRGYMTTVAVAPKYADLPTAPWVGAFDYAALGAAADRIFLMTYEWGWVGGPPMAIAPINQVRRVVEYAVSLIPRNKLIMGIPLYGYDWTLPDTPANLATTVDLNDVYTLALNSGATISYDTTAQSPWFNYTDSGGVTHEVWFEDARSFQAKYNLAREFALFGVGYWGYRNEPYGSPQNWSLLNDMFLITKY